MPVLALALHPGVAYGDQLAAGAVTAAERLGWPVIELRCNRDGDVTLPRGRLGFDAALTWLPNNSPVPLWLHDRGVAVVNCNIAHAGRLACVGQDLPAMGRSAARVLARGGRRSLALVRPATQSGISTERLSQPFMQRASRLGLPCAELVRHDRDGPTVTEMVAAGDTSSEPTQALLRGLAELPGPVGLFCTGFDMALHCCAAVASQGRTVPGDVAVLANSTHDERRALLHNPPLTTFQYTGHTVALAAVELAARLLDGEPIPLRVATVPPPTLVERESTGVTSPLDDLALAHKVILEQATAPISVGDLLQLVDVSHQTFNVRFKEAFGETPGAMIRRVRRERAEELLRGSGLSVSRIASICGFDNVQRFNVFFKREAGLPPTAWRAAQTP